MSPREQATAVQLLQRWLHFFGNDNRAIGRLPPDMSPAERAQLELLISQTKTFTGGLDSGGEDECPCGEGRNPLHAFLHTEVRK